MVLAIGDGKVKLLENLPKLVILAILGAGVTAVAYRWFAPAADAVIADIKVPELSSMAKSGKRKFDDNCAICHGANGAGSDIGPPLVHKIYNPGHHADQSFVIAAKRGVKSHHWRFGDMPPLPHVGERDVAAIVLYVRELQTANGIFFEPHRM